MILGIEIALIFMGFYALIKGRMPTNKNSKYLVHGWPARVIGVICLMPLPTSFLVAAVVAATFVAQGRQVDPKSFFWVGTAIEASILVACIIVISILSYIYRTPISETFPEIPVNPDLRDHGG